jgi:hypothetical protein
MRRLKGATPAADLAARERLEDSSNVNAAPLAESDSKKQCTSDHAHSGDGLAWSRDARGWVLRLKRRRLGRVFPDFHYPNMWRSRRADGRLSDFASLAWAKSVVLAAAEIELGAGRAIAPPNCQQNARFFETESPALAQNGRAATPGSAP